jgi:hypothetical protein
MTAQAMGRASELWSSYWFPETTGFRLAVCRILAVGTQLLLFRPSLEYQLFLLRNNDTYIEPQALTRWMAGILPVEVYRSPDFFQILYGVMLVAGIAALVGFFTRPSLFLFALGNWVLISHSYSYGSRHHPAAMMCIFLMILAFSPAGRALSLDSLLRRRRAAGEALTAMAFWPLRLMQIMLVLMYLSAGVCKIFRGGLDWFNGYTLQAYLLQDAIRWERPLGLWLAQQHYLCIALSIGAVLLELAFVLALFWKRSVPFLLVSGALLHIGIYVTQAAPFFQLLVLYAVFIDFDRLKEIIKGRGVFWRRELAHAG